MATRRLLPLLKNLRLRPEQMRPLARYDSTKSHASLDYRDTLKEDSVLSPFSTVNEEQKLFLEELKPPIKKSFNLAAYVNESKTLQELIKLGVSLYDIENTNYSAAQYYLTLDFEIDCLEHIRFLRKNGLQEKNVGRFITEFPMVFKEHIDDLQTRINYLEAKGFTKKTISRAINTSAVILSLPTKSLDFKLGQMQIELQLPAHVLRKIVVKHPQTVLHPVGQIRLTNFVLIEEFGFKIDEMHKILEAQPKLLDIIRPVLIERLDLVHNTIGLSHEMIVKFPGLITGPKLDIKHRSDYLKTLKRNQYDPSKPLYVPPSALYDISDEVFCTKYAKTNLDDYKLFLKSC